MARGAVLAPAIVALLQCSGTSQPQLSQGPTPIPGGREAVLVGAGDIAACGPGEINQAEATAQLLDRIPGTVFTAGDNAYRQGTAAQFRDCYEPTWGRHKSRTRPSPGNHEYDSPNAAPYFAYFGANAGPPGLGYYGFDVGTWRAISLNSNIAVNEGSPQMQWLRDELGDHPSACTVAIWHHPLFSSGPNGDSPQMRAIYRLLHDHDVDVVVTGHEHQYERYAPQDADGRPDPARGIRQFIVGTGGAPLYTFVRSRANSEAQYTGYGVLSLTLGQREYRWDFVPTDGGFRDSGSGVCH